MEALRRLQNVVRRVADQWRPALSDEAYRIVKQRLFEAEDAQSLGTDGRYCQRRSATSISRTRRSFPRKLATRSTRIAFNRPIRCTLSFSIAFTRTGPLSNDSSARAACFDLMNDVIHALWVDDDQAPRPSRLHPSIAVASVNAELTHTFRTPGRPSSMRTSTGLTPTRSHRQRQACSWTAIDHQAPRPHYLFRGSANNRHISQGH